MWIQWAMVIVAQEVPSLSPEEGYSSSAVLAGAPRELDLSAFLLLFPGEPTCARGASASSIFCSLCPPHTHPLPQMRARQFFGRQKLFPPENSPSLVPLSVNSGEVEAVLFLKGQVNLQSWTGQVQGWDLCASVDDPPTHLHLLGLGGVGGGVKPCLRTGTLCPLLQRDGATAGPIHLGGGRGRVGLGPASAPPSSDSLFLLVHVGWTEPTGTGVTVF